MVINGVVSVVIIVTPVVVIVVVVMGADPVRSIVVVIVVGSMDVILVLLKVLWPVVVVVEVGRVITCFSDALSPVRFCVLSATSGAGSSPAPVGSWLPTVPVPTVCCSPEPMFGSLSPTVPVLETFDDHLLSQVQSDVLP
jgi:hypothetical protein